MKEIIINIKEESRILTTLVLLINVFLITTSFSQLSFLLPLIPSIMQPHKEQAQMENYH